MSRPEGKPLKQFPVFRTDEEAEHFIDTADLSEYDFSGFKRVKFEFENKTARVNMRLPESQLALVKAEAKKRGLPYQRFIRELIDRGLHDLKVL
ncbi:CopG family antitoxin [Aurantimonas marianensis]|uniref:BrnA antitoxin family protein n=1 Tax=Aurantimonas marianensis TaxID=2920428 RepID=A0A9X2HD34_9HYPH|nr:BrnA antitoxin family protein [Aurantimonas marianensis]MCP3055444.1 BrnA antitoxin family protein [Aurantimonas marianensis]